MTQQTPLWVEEKAALTADQARTVACPGCGALLLCARAGRVAALDVRADAQPITEVQERLVRATGRLTWHLVPAVLPETPPRIQWRDRFHIAAGAARHPVIQDHECKETSR